MSETRQQRRARERQAAKQANLDRVHARVLDAGTIGHMWRVYYEERFGRSNPPLEPEHVAFLREVFYSGVAAMFELFNRVSADEVTEDRGVEMLARLHEELDVYTKGLR